MVLWIDCIYSIVLWIGCLYGVVDMLLQWSCGQAASMVLWIGCVYGLVDRLPLSQSIDRVDVRRKGWDYDIVSS